MDKLATLEEEIANVQNYYKIQRFRFGDKINFKIEYLRNMIRSHSSENSETDLAADCGKCRFPRDRTEDGQGAWTLKIQVTPKRLLITVADNGVGMEGEQVHELNDKLRGASLTYIKEDKENRRDRST